jgi:hypothetical protein
VEWHKKIMHIMGYIRAKELVSGAELESALSMRPTSVDLKAQEDYQNRSREAASIIVGSVSDNQLHIIEDLDDPVKMWKVLKEALDSRKIQ